MKLATLKDGSRDGQLVVVSRDLGSAHYATGIAHRLQQVLDDWGYLSPQLQDLYDSLNAGRARHAFPFDPQHCLAPLPRAYQCLQASAYLHHAQMAQEVGAASAHGASTQEPLLEQLASDALQGPCEDIVVESAAMDIDAAAALAVVTGDVARAILHYERGLKLAPGDADLRANLDLANEQVKDRLAGKPTLALGSTWASVRGGHDPDQWARRSLWASALFFALLAISLIAQHRALKRTLWALSAASLSFLLVCVAFASYRHRELTDDSAAIIVSPKVDVLGEPRSGSTVLFVLHKGTKVSVLQTTDGWYEVELPNGSIGWMPPATLERI